MSDECDCFVLPCGIPGEAEVTIDGVTDNCPGPCGNYDDYNGTFLLDGVGSNHPRSCGWVSTFWIACGDAGPEQDFDLYVVLETDCTLTLKFEIDGKPKIWEKTGLNSRTLFEGPHTLTGGENLGRRLHEQH